MKKHLALWSREPIHVPRWMLTAKYFAFMILGILSVIGGISSLELATFDAFTTYWSAGLVVSAAVAMVLSMRKEWEPKEKWAVLIVASLIVSWATAAIWRAAVEGDLGRITGAFGVLVISLLPVTRALGLLRNAGK